MDIDLSVIPAEVHVALARRARPGRRPIQRRQIRDLSRIRRRAFAVLLTVTISSLAVPAAVLAAVPVANDDPGTACGGVAFGGSFPIPEDYRVAGEFGEWFPIFGDCSVLANDTDPDGDPLTWEFVTAPAHGQVLKLEEDWFVYQVEPDYSTIAGDQPGGNWLSDSFTYHACDATDCSAPATMRFWIAPINDPPSFTGGPSLVEVDEDSGPYSGPWATDISPGPANKSAQTVQFEIVALDLTGVPDLFAVEPAISSSGVARLSRRAPASPVSPGSRYVPRTTAG